MGHRNYEETLELRWPAIGPSADTGLENDDTETRCANVHAVGNRTVYFCS